MAEGFKVADAFVAVHTEDDTGRGRRKIEKDTQKWSDSLGMKMGRGLSRNLLRGLTMGIRTGLTALTKLMLQAVMASLKLTAMAVAAGAVASAIGGLAAAISHLLPLIAGLAIQLKTAAGVFLLYPAVISTVLVAFATVKLAVGGLGAAFKALSKGDAAALHAALKKLAPSAAHVVQQIQKLKPAFDKLRLSLQSKLFAGLWRYIRDLGKLYIPILTMALGDMARVLNGTIKDVINFLVEKTTRIDLANILGAAARSADNLLRALRPVLRILIDVTLAGLQVLAVITTGLAPALDRFADRVSALRASGGLTQLITDGIDALKLFGGLVKNIVGILAGLFRASGASNGIFQFFDRLNKLINSASGQKALIQVFDALAQIGKALAPVMAALLQALVPLAKAIAAISLAFAPGLVLVVNGLAAGIRNLGPGIVALSPILKVLGQLLPPLGSALSLFLKAFEPGVVALLVGVGKAMSVLVNVAGPLGKALGSVVAAVGPGLAPLIQILADLLISFAPGVVTFLGALVDALKILAPIAPIVGKGLGAILEVLAPLLPLLVDILAPVLVDLAMAFIALAKISSPLLKALTGLVTIFVNEIVAKSLQQWAIIMPLLADAGLKLLAALAPLLPVLAQFVQTFIGEFMKSADENGPLLIQLITKLADAFVLLVQAGAQNLIKILQQMAPLLPDLARSFIQFSLAMSQLLVALLPLVPPFVDFMTKVVDFLVQSGLLKLALQVLTSAFGLTSIAIRVITGIINLLLTPLHAAKEGVQSFGSAVSEKIGKAKEFFGKLGETIKNAVGNLGHLLFDAGKHVIQGLIDGMSNVIHAGALGRIAAQAAQKIADAFPHSPAKVGPLSGGGDPMKSGRTIATRLAAGMRAGMRGLTAAARGLAGAASVPAPAGLAASGLGAATAAGRTTSPAHLGPYEVTLDGRVVTTIIVDTITGHPQVVAAATDEGRRTRGFVNSPRARI